jgi:hypothetical protein
MMDRNLDWEQVYAEELLAGTLKPPGPDAATPPDEGVARGEEPQQTAGPSLGSLANAPGVQHWSQFA